MALHLCLHLFEPKKTEKKKEKKKKQQKTTTRIRMKLSAVATVCTAAACQAPASSPTALACDNVINNERTSAQSEDSRAAFLRGRWSDASGADADADADLISVLEHIHDEPFA